MFGAVICFAGAAGFFLFGAIENVALHMPGSAMRLGIVSIALMFITVITPSREDAMIIFSIYAGSNAVDKLSKNETAKKIPDAALNAIIKYLDMPTSADAKEKK